MDYLDVFLLDFFLKIFKEQDWKRRLSKLSHSFFCGEWKSVWTEGFRNFLRPVSTLLFICETTNYDFKTPYQIRLTSGIKAIRNFIVIKTTKLSSVESVLVKLKWNIPLGIFLHVPYAWSTLMQLSSYDTNCSKVGLFFLSKHHFSHRWWP